MVILLGSPCVGSNSTLNSENSVPLPPLFSNEEELRAARVRNAPRIVVVDRLQPVAFGPEWIHEGCYFAHRRARIAEGDGSEASALQLLAQGERPEVNLQCNLLRQQLFRRRQERRPASLRRGCQGRKAASLPPLCSPGVASPLTQVRCRRTRERKCTGGCTCGAIVQSNTSTLQQVRRTTSDSKSHSLLLPTDTTVHPAPRCVRPHAFLTLPSPAEPKPPRFSIPTHGLAAPQTAHAGDGDGVGAERRVGARIARFCGCAPCSRRIGSLPAGASTAPQLRAHSAWQKEASVQSSAGAHVSPVHTGRASDWQPFLQHKFFFSSSARVHSRRPRVAHAA
eukprot:scaffold115557_cov72-Phaeocystis_antarctica.AAC.2